MYLKERFIFFIKNALFYQSIHLWSKHRHYLFDMFFLNHFGLKEI